MLIFFLRSLQKCKQWLLLHLIPSRTRTAPLAKYLLAYADSFAARQPAGADAKKGAGPSAKRRRLHILYVLNDVFYHVKSRTRNEAFFPDIAPHLPALFKSAASFENAPKHEKKLNDLVRLWQEKAYFPHAVLDQLRAAIAEGPKARPPPHSNGMDAARKATPAPSSRDAPFMLPSMHGDASTPWYDLPAANWLPVIEPNSTRPMNPSMIRPLQLAGGPADKSLVQAVKKLLGNVDKIYAEDRRGSEKDSSVDISQMGEIIERDEMGDVVAGETYYGWSRTFCEKMKARRRGDAMDIDADGRGRGASSRSSSRSRSRSRGRSSSSRGSSRPVFKRRRLSASSRSRTRSRTRDDRSWSGGGRSRRRSRSHSRSRSRSPSARRRQYHHHNDNGDIRTRDAYSPPPSLGTPGGSTMAPAPANPYGHPAGTMKNNNNGPPHNFLPLKPQPQSQFNHHHNNNTAAPPSFPGGVVPPPPPPNFLPPHLPHQQQAGAWNAHPLPPPPPQYQGPWPPPPPPPGNFPQPTHQGWFPPVPPPPIPPNVNSNNHSPTAAAGLWAGGWPQPPPPPPPPTQQGGGNINGGGYGYNGRGGNHRGGYHRGGRGGGYGRGRGW